jgi:hypothetical protein
MVRAELAKPRLTHPAKPRRIVGAPLLQVQSPGEPEPCGVHVMAAVGLQPQLSLEQARPTGGIDHPPRLERALTFELFEGHPMRFTELQIANTCSLSHVDAEPPRLSGELVLEQAPIDLIIVVLWVRERPKFEPLGYVAVAVLREKEAQPTLDQVLILEVVPHPYDFGEVVCSGWHGRLANLERRQWRWTLTLLEHHDARLGAHPLELDRQRQSCQSATQDCHVIAFAWRAHCRDLDSRCSALAIHSRHSHRDQHLAQRSCSQTVPVGS